MQNGDKEEMNRSRVLLWNCYNNIFCSQNISHRQSIHKCILGFQEFSDCKLLDKTFCKWLSKLETHCEFNEIPEDQRMKLICKLDDDVIEWLDHIQSCSV